MLSIVGEDIDQIHHGSLKISWDFEDVIPAIFPGLGI
jgi:hypothetical protein